MTAKQRRFVEEYCAVGNATQAAIRAGYSGRSAHAIGHENLKKVEIRAAIEKQMERHSMTAEEATVRLSAQARGEVPTRVTRNGDQLVEVYDSLRALETITRIIGLHRETHTDEPLIIRVVTGNAEAPPEAPHQGRIGPPRDASEMHPELRMLPGNGLRPSTACLPRRHGGS